MELPVVDLMRLPTEFRKLSVAALGTAMQANAVYSMASDTMTIPMSLRMDYQNTYGSHFALIGEGKSRGDKTSDLNKALSRFDLFDSKSIAKKDIRDALGIMVELSQTVLVCVHSSYVKVSQEKNYRYVDGERYKTLLKAEGRHIMSALRAYKLAIAYAMVKDTSLLEKVEPHVRLYIDTQKPMKMSYPDTGNNHIEAMALYPSFQQEYNNMVFMQKKIERLSKYTDPDDENYSLKFRQAYKAAGERYLVYPIPFMEGEKVASQ